MKTVKIKNREIGKDNPCYIIAEAGSNHNGKLEIAKKLIDVAVKAGADAVKFQIYQAENLYSKYTPEFSYLKGQNIYELIKSIETPREWIKELARYCETKNIIFLATPFDFEALERAWREARKPYEREHVDPYIVDNPDKFKMINVKNNVNLSHLRWTLDYPEDFEFITEIYKRLYPKKKFFYMKDILDVLDREPWLIDINCKYTEKS